MKKTGISERILSLAAESLREWECANITLDDCLENLRRDSSTEKSAVASLLFEYFRHKGFIDDLIRRNAKKDAVKQELRIILACAVTQALFQTGIATESAVNVAVDFAKLCFGRGAAGFVNAMLRSMLADSVSSKPPERSFPGELGKKWTAQFGKEEAEKAISFFASNPPLTFRVRAELPQEKLASLGCARISEDFTGKFEFMECAASSDFFTENWLEKGMVYVQDIATSLPLSLLEGRHITGKVLDACAAPGGKTIMLADMLGESDVKITAADRSQPRISQMNINFKRAGIKARTMQASANETPFPPETFDLILADVPCTNSGVIRRRPDAPWRFNAKRSAELVAMQAEILDSLSGLVRKGGLLLYSTCSVEPEEDSLQVEKFLLRNKAFSLEKQRLLLPSAKHDGAYAALMVKC